MFVGLIKDTNERVYIDEAITINKDIEYVCPICNGVLIIKKGKVNVSHFAHKSLSECDTFSSDMSEWHKDWQNIFPKKNQEVVLELDTTNIQYEGAARVNNFSDMSYEEFMEYKKVTPRKKIKIRHRADVLACGYVIEFQHSPISCKEFNERNWFYRECGKKVIWVFDFAEEYKFKRIICKGEWSNKRDNGAKYKWNYPSKIFANFIPQDHKPQYVNDKWWDGDITVFFQLYDSEDVDDCIMEKVIWVLVDDNGHPTFKHFMTSYYPGNKKELLEWVKERKI